MSLQVWLPLNGDLHNQGLNNIQFINNGATIDNNGKLGKCYSFNGSSNTIYNRNISINCNKLSMCCWIYRNSSSTAEGYIASLNNGAGYIDTAIGLDASNATTIVFVGGGNSTLRTTIASNTWIHVAVTYDGQKIKGYINGQKIGEQTNTTILNKSQLAIGCRCDSTNSFKYYFPGKINDFRLYDHALSDKEVEEISKGLVLHYKLDNYYLDNYFINPNLLLDTNVNGLTKVNASYNRYYESNGSGSYTCTWKAITDPPIQGINYGLQQKVTRVSGFHSVTWYQNGYVSVTTGTTYTMSCYVKVISGTDLSFKFQYGKSPYVANTQTLKNDNEWHQYSWTFTPNTASGQAAANGTTRIYCGGLASVGEVLICGWKLEEGNTATPWCETTYSPPNISNIVYDCSGYGNNGTIVGNLTSSSNTPKYNSSIYFSGNGNLIKLTPFYFDTENWTVGFWYYHTLAISSTWNSFICLSKGNGADANKKFALMFNNGSSNHLWCKVNSGSARTIPVKVNTWTYLTLTSEGKVYENGILKSSSISPGANMTGTYDLVIGSRSASAGINTTSTQYTGNISDVRIYSTVLTEKQIKELYNTSVTIDNEGNIYTREEIENNNNLNINKNGQFYNNEIIDSSSISTASISKTKIVSANNFYEY